MSMDISITLSDSDLALFVDGMKSAQKKVDNLDAVSIVGAARKLLEDTRCKELPDFVATRLKHLETMIAMVEDAGFGLPAADRDNVLAALTYFASPDDLVPDSVPVLGLLDDAIMIELCALELRHEIEAYNDFRKWRDNEASRRSLNTAELMLTRVDWAEARRVETIERMHRQREESYVSGTWAPVLFKVR
ncbi:MAG TPA: YkvA family protein [Rhodanobacter sp.]|nr:YkvA family protein [Rhodanobacter sp.]